MQEDESEEEVQEQVLLKKPAAAAAEEEEEYQCEWHRELSIAYRFKPSKPKKQEFAEPIEEDEAVHDEHEQVIATFLDGMKLKISGLTYGMLKEARKARTAVSECLWSKEHKGTHQLLKIRQRKERSHQLSLYDQGRQVDQLRIWPFAGGLPLPFETGPAIKVPRPILLPDDHKIVLEALDMFKIVAGKYAADIITLDELKTEKAELLSAYQNKKRVTKRWAM